MHTHKLFFIIGALLFFQVNGDVWENAKEYLDEFTTTVQKSVYDTIISFYMLPSIIAGERMRIVRDMDETLTELTDYMISAIDDIRNQADETNIIEVEHCVMLYGDQMTELPIDISRLVNDCLQGLAADCNTEIGKANGEISDKRNIADDLANSIEACRTDEDPEDCVAKVSIFILIQTLEVPETIQNIAERTMAVVDSFKDELSVCSVDRITSARPLADELLGYIRTCANLN